MKRASIKARRNTEKMNEAINLFAKIDEEKHRRQYDQDNF